MGILSTFFGSSQTHWGNIFPEHFLVAIFPSFQEAEQARNRIRGLGVLEEDSIAVPGAEVMNFAHEHKQSEGLTGLLMTALSRAIGTEAAYEDKDLEMAQLGAAFLVVRCANARSRVRTWTCLEPLHPVVARHCALGGIEHLAGEA